MICPKCGRPVPEAAVICPACDFILDTDFLGEEILDEERKLRPGAGGVEPSEFNLADAVILGDIDETSQTFETSDTGFHVKETTGARLYVSGRSQALMAPDAIPAALDDAAPKVRLTPFEKHVLSFIDGERPVETIRRAAGLDETEVKTALATLADKGVVQVIGRALVDLGQPEAVVRKRPERRRLRRDIAGAMGAISDETDQAIEEAFKTQTGLSPLDPKDLGPDLLEDQDSLEDASAPGEDVFSDIGDSQEFERPKPTNELLSLASSATPVEATPQNPPARAESTNKSFVPVSRTADPSPFSGSDGFDSFGSGTQQVELDISSSESGASEASPAPDDESGTGVDLFHEPNSEEEMSIAAPGSEAIAHLANSQLAGKAMDDGAEGEEGTLAKAPNFGLALSRLLSDADQNVDDDDGPFASLVGAPDPERSVPPPVAGTARTSSIQSAEGEYDDFDPSEESSTGLMRPQRTSTGDEEHDDAPSAALGADEDTPVGGSLGAEGLGDASSGTEGGNDPRQGLRGATGEIDDLLAALSEEESAPALADAGGKEQDEPAGEDRGGDEGAPPAPKGADEAGARPSLGVDDAAHEALVRAASEVGSDLEPLSEMSLPAESALADRSSASLDASLLNLDGGLLDDDDDEDTAGRSDTPPRPAAADESEVEQTPAVRGPPPALSEVDASEEQAAARGPDTPSEAPSEEGAPPEAASPASPPSSIAPETRVVDMSEEPALSALVDGFNDDSFLEPDSAVFDRPSAVAPSSASLAEPVASPPPETSDPAHRPPDPAVLEEGEPDGPSTGEVSEVFTRDGAGDEGEEPDLEASDEQTNLLENPHLAYGYRGTSGAVPLGPTPPRVGVEGSDEATALRAPGEIPGLPAAPPPAADDAQEDGPASSELISESAVIRGQRASAPPAGASEPAHELSVPAAPPVVDSIVEDSVLSELAPDESGYDGSELGDDESQLSEAEDEDEDEDEDESAVDQAAYDESEASDPSVLNSDSGGRPIDHALPSSLIDDSALASEVEPGIRSASGPEDDPDATAYVQAPSGLASALSNSSQGSWAGGTHEYQGKGALTGEASQLDDHSHAVSSTGMGEAVSEQGRGLGSDEMAEKARRLFRDALRDYKSGRASRAKMNAKLATIYDPDNEEYRVALEQWEGSAQAAQTNGKPREVLLYEEAQRLEAADEFDGAISLLRQGIEVNPRIAAFHNRLGVILALRKHDYEQAADCVKKAIELEPDNMHYKSNYGKIVQKARMKGQLRTTG